MTSRERAQADELAAAAAAPEPVPVHLSAAAAAEILGVSEKTIRRLVKAGRLRHLRVGRLIRIPADALQELEGDPGAAARAGQHAAVTRRPPAAREPRGKFARMARGLPVDERLGEDVAA